MDKKGYVYLVGAGPGDEGLITVKGAFLLSCCDCVVYDHLVPEGLLAYGKEGCEKIFAGKEKGCHSKSQEEIQKILIDQAKKGKMVVRLKGGDPYVFGRGKEEAAALKEAGIFCEVVPGVTSAVAVPSAVGIPVTYRQVSRSFHVFTGHTKEKEGLPEEFYQMGRCGGTMIFLMGISSLGKIVDGMLNQGWSAGTPVAVIQNGTLPCQRAVFGTLEDIEKKVQEAGIGAPAVIVAGETAGLPERPLEQKHGPARPLEGIRVGLTGTDHLTRKLKMLLESLGARAEVVCRLTVLPLSGPTLEESYGQLDSYTWLVFTSANGVRLYLEGLLGAEQGQQEKEQQEKEQPRKTEKRRDLRCLGGLKIAAIGRGTEEALEKFYLQADYVPGKASGLDLAQGLAGRLTKADRVLIPRAKKGSPELTERLEQAGIPFCDLPVYDVEGDEKVGQDPWNWDFLVFASGSGVSAFFSGNRCCTVKRPKFCCIGEATARVLKSYGFQADYIAKEASAEGIVKEIILAQMWLTEKTK